MLFGFSLSAWVRSLSAPSISLAFIRLIASAIICLAASVGDVRPVLTAWGGSGKSVRPVVAGLLGANGLAKQKGERRERRRKTETCGHGRLPCRRRAVVITRRGLGRVQRPPSLRNSAASFSLTGETERRDWRTSSMSFSVAMRLDRLERHRLGKRLARLEIDADPLGFFVRLDRRDRDRPS